MNLVEAVVTDGVVEFGGYRLPLDRARRPAVADGERVILGIRPEDFEDAAFGDAGAVTIDVTPVVLEELGSDAHVIFEVAAPRVEAEELRAAGEDDDTSLIADSQTSLFNARVNPRTTARAGAPLTLAVRPGGFHFFDRTTGDNALTAAPVGADPSHQGRRGGLVRLARVRGLGR
jgi:multiple sugar transport system ATP-binding protein